MTIDSPDGTDPNHGLWCPEILRRDLDPEQDKILKEPFCKNPKAVRIRISRLDYEDPVAFK